MMTQIPAHRFRGLSAEEVAASAARYGHNRLPRKREWPLLRALRDLAKEPMVILLLVAAAIYFVSGDTGDGLFMVAAIILVSAISIYQESRSRSALKALHALTAPACKLIRGGEELEFPAEEIVIGDIVISEEGTVIPADGEILRCNDFSVNESLLTGESLPVFKSAAAPGNHVFQGTQVASGLAIFRVTAIGANTRLGKIGESLASVKEEPTPLQVQVTHFVKRMAAAGLLVFVAVWAIHFYQSRDALHSLLHSLTLAMSILPEEIPVAFATFMAIGAWRLMKRGIIVKQTRTVETLGSATVICTDKTGTLTTNQMTLAAVYLYPQGRILEAGSFHHPEAQELVQWAMWASEPIPFDPMEKALHEAYAKLTAEDLRPQYRLLHEYPISGRPPMMTHVFENESGHQIIAAKGAPEALLRVSELNADEQEQVERAVGRLSQKGYRVLGVGTASWEGDAFPGEQQQISFRFHGLVAFQDPPRENVPGVLQSFYQAGIQVKIITGDNAETTRTIAEQVGFRGAEKAISGDALMRLSEAELKEVVGQKQVYVRMFPEAKLRIIRALQARGEVVAMTGDGVNDGPALRAAHIGIAMGKRGAEVARQASSLILTHDDLGEMVTAIAMGRRIYNNLKKAIRYIISIHIPIVLTVFLPLALGWAYPAIFTPVHIIFLELIMGPTCSIIYENEPAEKNLLYQPPRPFTTTFFNARELGVSILQGLVITIATLGMYQWGVQTGAGEDATRTLVFLTLISANIFLTLVNRSFFDSLLTTIRYRNPLVPAIIAVTVLLTGALLLVPSLARFFSFAPVSLSGALMALAAGMLSTVWYEAVKAVHRRGRSARSR
jgi:Ca2+-transporting ATPase